MACKGGRVPSFDEYKTVKTSITSLQGPHGQDSFLSSLSVMRAETLQFPLTQTWSGISPPALPFLVGEILDQVDMLRAEGADYWIRIGSGKDRRQ